MSGYNSRQLQACVQRTDRWPNHRGDEEANASMPVLKVDTSTTPTYRTDWDYWNLPEGVRAELIDGKLYNMAPPSYKHQLIVGGLTQVLRNHVDANGGPCKVIPAPFAVNLFNDKATYLEPDVSVICDSSKLDDRGCNGAPDLVVEVVSPSSRRMDCLIKATRYEQAHVREYWIVDPMEEQTIVYRYDSEQGWATTYPFDKPIPVGIWDGALKVQVSKLL